MLGPTVSHAKVGGSRARVNWVCQWKVPIWIFAPASALPIRLSSFVQLSNMSVLLSTIDSNLHGSSPGWAPTGVRVSG